MAFAANTPEAPKNMGRSPGTKGWLLLSPLLLWLAIFVVAPTAILVAYSFGTPRGPARVDPTFSIEGYRSIVERGATTAVDEPIDPSLSFFRTQMERANRVYLKLPYTIRIFLRSIFFAAVTTFFCVILGYPVAYFIGRAPPQWRNRLLLLVMIPFWTSFMIRTYAWILILQKNGLVNATLESAGFGFRLEILFTPWAELLGLVYSFLPFMILPIYTSVEKLDNAMIEAAFDLGAGPVRAFRSVIVPLTQPGIVAGILLVFIPAIGMFAVTDVLGGKKRDMIGNLIERQFVGRGGDWAYGSALGVVLLLVFVICYWLTSLRTEREES